VDYGGRMAVMALIRKEEGPEIVGIGTYDVDPGTGWAEVALTVVDEFQNYGLGTEMFRTLMEYGRDLNLKGFTAEILATNIRMINIFHFSGLKVESKMVDDIIQVRAFL
jgi:RimJ/RimL family protein N-acetyltransferase